MRIRDFLLSLVMLVIMISITACNANTSPSLSYNGYDFSGNTVLVVMTKEAGGVNKIHDKETFGEIARQIVEIEDLTYKNDPENALINWEKFQQILYLTLNRYSKSNVLRVVKYLNQLDVVDVAEPNLYMQLD